MYSTHQWVIIFHCLSTLFSTQEVNYHLWCSIQPCVCVWALCVACICVWRFYSGPNRDILWLRRKRTQSASLVVNKVTRWSADQSRQGPWKSFMSAQLHFKRSELYFKIMLNGYRQHSSVCFALGIEWLSVANSRACKPFNINIWTNRPILN